MHSASSSHLHATEALLENALDFSQATWKKAGLLCENANSKVTAYRRHPPGKLDWNRASKGRTDIWKGKHAIPTDGNKKTIVIADPTLEIVKSGLLAQLLDQGFSLFCISIITNQLEKIEWLNSFLIRQQDRMQIISNDDVIEICKKADIEADQVVVIDYFKTREILSIAANHPMELPLLLLDDIDPLIPYNYLSTATRPQEALSNMRRMPAIGIKIGKEILGNENKARYRADEKGKREYFEFLWKLIKHNRIEYLHIDFSDPLLIQFLYEKKAFSQVKTLIITAETNHQSLCLVLSQCEQLKKLKIDFISDKPLAVRKILPAIPHPLLLEECDIRGNFKSCIKVFEPFSNLTNVKQKMVDRNAGLHPNLTELEITNPTLPINITAVLRFLLALPHLETLTLCNVDFQEGPFFLLPPLSLKKLNLINTNITDENLGYLLSRCPQLTSLNITGCRQLRGIFTERSISLPALEEINLSFLPSVGTIMSLSTLLEHSPLLKRVIARGHDINDLRLLNFPQLFKYNSLIEYVDLSVSIIDFPHPDLHPSFAYSDQLMKRLNEAFPNLQNLNLTGHPLNSLALRESFPQKLRVLSMCYTGHALDFHKMIKFFDSLQVLHLGGDEVEMKLEQLLIRTEFPLESLYEFHVYFSRYELASDKRYTELIISLERFKARYPHIKFKIIEEQSTPPAPKNKLSIKCDLYAEKEECTKIDTINDQKIYKLTEYFLPKKKPVPPNHYRLGEIITQITLRRNGLIREKAIPDLTPYTQHQTCSDVTALYYKKYENNPDFHLGRIKLKFKPEHAVDGLSLPSLTPQDKLIFLSDNIAGQQVQIDKKGRFYFVKPKIWEEGDITTVVVSYIIHAQLQDLNLIPRLTSKAQNHPIEYYISTIKELQFVPADDSSDEYVLDTTSPAYRRLSALSDEDKITALTAYARTFEEGDLKTLLGEDWVNTHPDFIDHYNQILRFGIGSCEHRNDLVLTIGRGLGLDEEKLHLTPNGCHIYAETKRHNRDPWIQRNLGGYSGPPDQIKSLSIKKPQPPRHPQKEKEKEKEKEPPMKPRLKKRDCYYQLSNEVLPREDVSQQMALYIPWLYASAMQLPPHKRNLLVTFDSEQQITTFNAAFMRYLAKNKKGYYYLPDFEHIEETHLVVQQEELTQVPSPFMHLLKDPSDGNMLCINWSHAKSEDVGFNTFLDKNRRCLQQPLPSGLIVIVALPVSQVLTLRKDLNSRIQFKTAYPAHLPLETIPKISEPTELPTINLYHDDWEMSLLGRLRMKKTIFSVKKGPLIEALELAQNQSTQDQAPKQTGLVILNPPMDSLEFCLFMQEAWAKKKIYFNGQYYPIPDHFTLQLKDAPYELTGDYAVTTWNPLSCPPCDYTLQAQTFENFFMIFDCEKLKQKKGWIESHATDTPLRILVTEAMKESDYAKLLDTALKHTIIFYTAPGITLPKEMEKRRSVEIHDALPTEKEREEEKPQHTLIVTNDIDLAELKITEPLSGDYKVISIDHSLDPSDVIATILNHSHDTTFSFKAITLYVGRELLNGRTIILKGAISLELAHYLETLFIPPAYSMLINNKMESPKGRLIIITDQTHFSSVVPRQSWTYQEQDYWEQLTKEFGDECVSQLKTAYQTLNDEHPLTFTYVQLKGMLQDMQYAPQRNPFKSYLFQHPNHQQLIPASKRAYKQVKKEQGKGKEKIRKNKDIFSQRAAEVYTHFKHRPYLFIAGPTSAGKSTFVKKELEKYYQERGQRIKIIHGVKKLKAYYASPDRPKDQFVIAVFDEAHLNEIGSLNFLEGYFNRTPGFLIEGEFVDIDMDYLRVLAIGNLDRDPQSLFDRHGSVKFFKTLPDYFLTETMLLPPLQKLSAQKEFPWLADVKNQIVSECLASYHSITTTPPLTPRNLKMICLRTILFLYEHPDLFPLHEENSIGLAVRMAVYDEAERGLNVQSKLELQAELGALRSQLNSTLPKQLGTYTVTPSRANSLRLLMAQTNMQQWRLKYPAILSAFGTHGMLFEGESSVGKTDLFQAYLEAAHIPYVQLTPTDTATMKRELKKAKKEEKWVLIDEINSLPKEVEKTLNKLMDQAEESGSGFMVFATQNPISYGGRKRLHPALENRFFKPEDLPKYPETEVVSILETKNDAHAKEKAACLQLGSEYAQKHHLPEPTLRTLLDDKKWQPIPPRRIVAQSAGRVNQTQLHHRENPHKTAQPPTIPPANSSSIFSWRTLLFWRKEEPTKPAPSQPPKLNF